MQSELIYNLLGYSLNGQGLQLVLLLNIAHIVDHYSSDDETVICIDCTKMLKLYQLYFQDVMLVSRAPKDHEG